MAGAVRRPHVLTKAYIRAWADDRGAVEVIDVERNRGIRTSINNATVVRDAYEPLVLTHDLEGEYSKIESRGLRVIEKMRREEPELTTAEMISMVAFLDMYLDRGRYADQAGILVQAVLLKTDGIADIVDFNAADRLLLSQGLRDVIRLARLGLENWEWRLQPWPHALVTGDGAVLLLEDEAGTGLCTVAFPLSPSQMLVIGKPLRAPISVNDLIASKCRRWIIGSAGTLKMGELEVTVE